MANKNDSQLCIVIENRFRGGLETVLLSLLDECSKNGIRVTLLTNITNPSLKTITSRSFHNLHLVTIRNFATRQFFTLDVCRNLKTDRLLMFPKSLVRKLFELPLIIFTLRSYYKIFKRNSFDACLIINGGYPGSIACRAAAISWRLTKPHQPMAFAINGIVPSSRFGFRIMDMLLDSWFLKSSPMLIAVSDTCKNSFIQRNNVTAKQSVQVILNGVRKSEENQIIKAYKTRLNTNILTLASYTTNKGHEFLFQCFASVLKSVPNAFLICAGDDPENRIPALRELLLSLGIHESVNLMIFQENQNLLLDECDIVAIPSQISESFSLVAAEALCRGIPVVGTNVGAIPEIAPSGEGSHLFDKDDFGGFSRAIILLLQDKAHYTETSYRAFMRSLQIPSETEMAKSYVKAVFNES